MPINYIDNYKITIDDDGIIGLIVNLKNFGPDKIRLASVKANNADICMEINGDYYVYKNVPPVYLGAIQIHKEMSLIIFDQGSTQYPILGTKKKVHIVNENFSAIA